MQAFRTLLSNNAHTAFQYPLTTYPLSLSDSKGDLRQGNKSNFRNYLISESGALTTVTLLEARWIYGNDNYKNIKT